MPNCLEAARKHNEIDWQSYHPQNRDDGADFLPTAHIPFLPTTTTITAPENQQRNGETTDNNAKCYLSDAGDASNSLIQASIARFALSTYSAVSANVRHGFGARPPRAVALAT
jgi:hypothetical protein